MKMKKMLFGAFLGMFALVGVAALPNQVSAQDSDLRNPDPGRNLLSNNQTLTGSALLVTIKNAVNWVLRILATIALIICLYGGFLMVTAASDDNKYKNGVKVLKNAAIGLAIIGLSWMIVSVVFWFISTLGGGKETGYEGVVEVTSDGEGTWGSDGAGGAGGNPVNRPY